MLEDILIGNGIRINGRDYEIVGITGGGDHYVSGGHTVFQVFDESPYEYLEVRRGGITGNTIVARTPAMGIFRLRAGLIVGGEGGETSEQGATLHIHPDEPFISFAPSNREHYRLTLVPTDYSDFDEES